MSYGQGEPPWDPWKPGSQQPQWGNQTDQTPDWAALAEASESRNKRRRLLLIVGGAFATVAIGAAVAVAVVSANDGTEASNKPANLPATADIPSSSTAPARRSTRRRPHPRWIRRTSSPAPRRTRPRSARTSSSRAPS
ncbi:hypothetical protein SAV14893_044530 [Streptomyces avermitilis]|uniref:Uncharacterized protein n=1 Tax=Streptomyces avermitilis TaxID=33903 RepID=A0A4D4LYM6_STRAX|nr:hypothetical protein SAV14893_044530 [Streptomyces avermitilis]